MYSYPPARMNHLGIRSEVLSQADVRVRDKAEDVLLSKTAPPPSFPTAIMGQPGAHRQGGRSRVGAAKCEWLSALWGGGQLLMPDYPKTLQKLEPPFLQAHLDRTTQNVKV